MLGINMNKLDGGVMDVQKEKIKQEFWNWAKVENPRVVENAELGDVYATRILDHMFMGFAAAKAQAVPDGFVLVKKELPEQIAEKMAIDRIDKPRHENDPVWSEIAEQSYKDQVKSKKWEFWRDYKAMIEAQEPAND